MKWTPVLLILFYNTAKAQAAIDTLPNAKAFSSTYINIPQYGVMANGHPYAIGLTLSQNSTFPYWITRIDLVTHQIDTVRLLGTISFVGGYWNSAFDSSGHLWLPINIDNYHVFEIDFKQANIVVYDRGLPFVDDNNNPVTALAYSIQLGTDGNIHVGAKGNPYIAYWDRLAGHWVTYSALNNIGIDWVLQVGGDNKYFYAVSGQNDTCNFWVVRKSDGLKRNLNRVPSYTRQTLYVGNVNHVQRTYFRDPYKELFYEVVNMDTIRVPYPDGIPATYYECNNGIGQPTVSSFWDASKSKLYYTLNGVNDSVAVTTFLSQSNIQLVIVDRYNANRLYYVGVLYGNFYGYDIAKDSSWSIGNTGYNLYSYKRLNDSIFFLGNYPGGALMEWNIYKEWTANKFMNGAAISVFDTSANPHIIHQFKNDACGFSHLSAMIIDTVKHLVYCAGNVIRTDETFSLGVYNYITKQGWGYDYHKIDALRFSSMTQYRDLIIASSNNQAGGTPKFYYYNPATNEMVDSLSFGWTDYGISWVQGDQLIGYAGTRFYKINLSTKQVIYNQQGTGTPTISRLQDGKFVIFGGTCPVGWGQCKPVNYNNFTGIGNNDYYSVSGAYIIRSKNLATEVIDLESADGKEKYIKNLLYSR